MSLKSKKILQLIPALESGGAETIALETAIAAAKYGWMSYIASSGGQLENRLKGTDIQSIYLPLDSRNALTIFKNSRALKKLIEEEQIDLVHAHSRLPAWQVYQTVKKLNIPFVTSYHGAYSQKGPFKAAYNQIMARGDMVFTHSAHTKNLVSNRHLKTKKDQDKLHMIPAGIDLDHYNPAHYTAVHIKMKRQAWGVKQGAIIIYHPARFSPIKGQEITIKAAAYLKQNNQIAPFHFVLTGDHQGNKKYIDHLKEIARNGDCEDQISIFHSETDMPLAYLASDIVVNPSLAPETFGLTVAESLAMGRPVIVSNGGALPEILSLSGKSDPIGGRIINQGAEGELAEAILDLQKLVKDKNNELEKTLRAHIKNHYSLPVMMAKTTRLYEKLLLAKG